MIVHKYMNREGGMGFGDFLRGSCATQQLSYRYGITPIIDFSEHSIGKYLVPSHNIDATQYRLIECRNIGDFSVIALRNEISKHCRFSYLSRDIDHVNIYTNVYPKFPLTTETKNFVKASLQPTSELQSLLPNIINTSYEVIHIRAGDLYAFGKAYDYSVNTDKDIITASITSKVESIIASTSNPILIMSDSLELKTFLTSKFNTISTPTIPVHVSNANENALDTLIDYFTLVNAKKIHQFSVHPWGSGFSDTVAYIFDVPIEKYSI